MNKPYIIIIGVIAAMLASCKPQTPREYIQPGDMEDILVDYHVAKAMAQQSSVPYNQELYLDAVLEKHGVTRADFDSSLVYYYTRSDRFVKMYRRVADRLQEKALALGATEGEIGMYSSLNAEGDTANVWAERNTLALMAIPPYNRKDFVVETDSTYMDGDAFLLQFMVDFVVQEGMKDGWVYVAAVYQDTIVTRCARLYNYGLNQLRLDGAGLGPVKALKGFFYIGKGGPESASTTQRILIVKNIQMIRFHKKQEDVKEEPDNKTEEDSIPPVDNSGGDDAKPIGGGNNIGVRRQVLSFDERTAVHRVVEQSDSIKEKSTKAIRIRQ